MNYKMSSAERIIYIGLFFVLALIVVTLLGKKSTKNFESGESFSAKSGSSNVSEVDKQIKPININTAGYLEFMDLPGIGEKKAAAIIEYRSEHGKFASPEDIMNVPGIGNATYDGFKDLITVGE